MLLLLRNLWVRKAPPSFLLVLPLVALAWVNFKPWQTVTTVVGTTYTFSFDVYAQSADLNTAQKSFCSSADSNGQMIIRAGETLTSGVVGGGMCGSSGSGATDGDHCHGDHRLCPQTSDTWTTVSGTYTATATKTTIAMHSESELPA